MSSTDKKVSSSGKKIVKKIVKVPALSWSKAPLNTASYDPVELNKQYKAGKPFPHIALQNFASDKKFLVSIRNELAKLELIEKSTDLYSVQQSPDLANIDSSSVIAKKHLPCTMMLRDALYSQEFRDLISAIAGCGPLNAKPDMAASAYTHTSHLLVHDDVISTRKIAYIIYLTQEEVNWCAADGGALELYPKSKECPEVPDCCPETRILPLFNQMAFFTVVSGESFHAVQEVYARNKARLSVQGWFHADTTFTTEEKQMSLKSMKKEVQKYSAAPTEPISIAGAALPSVSTEAAAPTSMSLSEQDKRYLAARGINPIYLTNPTVIAQLARDFSINKAVSLQGLFVEELQEALKALVLGVDSAHKCGTFFSEGEPPEDRIGVDEHWSLTGPPHIQRFLKLKLNEEEERAYDAKVKAKKDAKSTSNIGEKRNREADDDDLEEDEELEKSEGEEENPSEALAINLKRLIRQVFRSEAFARFVNIIIATATNGLGFKARSIVGRRFRPGLDYTVATVPSEEPRVCAVFTTCFTELDLQDPDDKEDDDDQKESIWESCECGGFDGIITAQDDTNPEVLQLHANGEEEDGVVNLPCVANSLSIFLCNTNQMHFTKYVDSSAPSSRVDITTEFIFDGNLPEEDPSTGNNSDEDIDDLIDDELDDSDE